MTVRHAAFLSVVATAASLLTAEVCAMLPASREELVCGAASMVSGEIVLATSRDCRLHMAPGVIDCMPTDLVDIDVRVDNVLPGSAETFVPFAILQASASVRNLKPIAINGRVERVQFEEDGTPLVAGSGSPLSDTEIAAALVGRRFLFALWPMPPIRQRTWIKMWTEEGPALSLWRTACPQSPWRPNPR